MKSESSPATPDEPSYDWMNEARALAAQCWCDPETSGKEMDATLAEAVAKRIASWMRDANRYARNADYWRNRAEVSEAVNRLVAPSETATPKKLWLWKNFVDGRPEYWAFSNPYPCHPNGDPITLGEPCGYAIFKPSTVGRTDVSEAEVIAAIKRAKPSAKATTAPLPIEVVSLLNTAATHLRTWVLIHRRGSKDQAPYANTESVAERLDYFLAHGELPEVTHE